MTRSGKHRRMARELKSPTVATYFTSQARGSDRTSQAAKPADFPTEPIRRTAPEAADRGTPAEGSNPAPSASVDRGADPEDTHTPGELGSSPSSSGAFSAGTLEPEASHQDSLPAEVGLNMGTPVIPQQPSLWPETPGDPSFLCPSELHAQRPPRADLGAPGSGRFSPAQSPELWESSPSPNRQMHEACTSVSAARGYWPPEDSRPDQAWCHQRVAVPGPDPVSELPGNLASTPAEAGHVHRSGGPTAAGPATPISFQESTTLTLRELSLYIRSLPTKADMDSIITKWSSGFRKELNETKAEVKGLQTAVQDHSTQQAELTQRLLTLENTVQRHSAQFMLHMDDLENRSRRNNIKIRGLPEATADMDLKAVAIAIFNTVLGRPSAANIEIDRIHRLFVANRGNDDPSPRDVLCRVHFYAVKEEIMRKARDKGRIVFDGAELILLPDLSRRTLAMRRIIRPLLDTIRAAGGTYYWGYPFSLTIRRDSRTFLLTDPRQLPEAFAFLQVVPIAVPDWLTMDLPVSGPLPQRGRRRRAARRRRRSSAGLRSNPNGESSSLRPPEL